MDRKENQRINLRQDWKYAYAARNGTKAKVVFLWICNSKVGTRNNDHHREGQRKEKRGRHPTSWLTDIKSSTGMTLQEAMRAAEDSERCRRIVQTTASHNATSH